MRSHYTIATRAPSRPRGKWHLLVNPTIKTTICGQRALRWDTMPRDELNPRDICTNCLRDTP